jgi:hypothetical protein
LRDEMRRRRGMLKIELIRLLANDGNDQRTRQAAGHPGEGTASSINQTRRFSRLR